MHPHSAYRPGCEALPSWHPEEEKKEKKKKKSAPRMIEPPPRSSSALSSAQFNPTTTSYNTGIIPHQLLGTGIYIYKKKY